MAIGWCRPRTSINPFAFTYRRPARAMDSHDPSTVLQTLAPIQSQRKLLPDNQSPRLKALAHCKRIGHVEVAGSIKLNGSTHFIVHVFHTKPQSNIPTIQNVQDKLPGGQLATASAIPDALFYHRFSSFVNLRHECYFHANTGHASSRSCSYCTTMAQLLYDGPMLPRLHMKLFHGDASICQALEIFLNSVLQLVNTLPNTPSTRLCDGQQEIPMLLYKFLSVPVEDKPTYASLQSTQGAAKSKTSPWSF